MSSRPDEDDLFDLIRNGNPVSSLSYDESVTTHSFVVVNADTNLILEDASDLKELTCSPGLELQRILVDCDRGASTMEAGQHRPHVWSKVAHPRTNGGPLTIAHDNNRNRLVDGHASGKVRADDATLELDELGSVENPCQPQRGMAWLIATSTVRLNASRAVVSHAYDANGNRLQRAPCCRAAAVGKQLQYGVVAGWSDATASRDHAASFGTALYSVRAAGNIGVTCVTGCCHRRNRGYSEG